MTEEEFWKSNPTKIEVWETAWKEEQKYKNQLIHSFVGTYVLNAVSVAIDHSLNGPKARSKYIEKPIQLFPLTEEEKKAEQKKAIAQFMEWAKAQQKQYGKEGNNNGTND